MKDLLWLMRPHQWVKNGLVFLAAGLAHELTKPMVIEHVLIAFASFCAAASAGYIINDIFDIHADKAHPRKRFRPLPSGTVTLNTAKVLCLVLLVLAFALAASLSIGFLGIVGLYLLTTIAYSIWLKQIVLLDVLVLVVLYTLRIVGGGIAAGPYISNWLYAFSVGIFASLAFMKRYVELCEHPGSSSSLQRRGYTPSHTSLVQWAGILSGAGSVIVFVLYIQSIHAAQLYAHTSYLFGIAAILAIWLVHVWRLAIHRTMHDDPVAFATRDAPSIICAILTVVILYMSAKP